LGGTLATLTICSSFIGDSDLGAYSCVMSDVARIKVAFADDHQVLIEGLAAIYSAKDDLEVVGTGHDADDALRIVEEQRPDVIVMDLSMPGDSFAAIEDIIRRHPLTKIVVFSASTAIAPAVELIETGIAGYVLKGGSSAELHEAIRIAHRGGSYVTPGFATKLIVSMKTAEIRRKNQPVAPRLHIREEQIVGCLLKGMTNQEIGDALNLSEKTVKHYMTSMLAKMNAKNRVQLVVAIKNRQVDTGAS
jgi:two-component system nitrate/nitrite response regulator NarL